jgi:hypothetical protein
VRDKGEFFLYNGWLIIQLYHDKVIQVEFWNAIQVFILANGNINQSQLSLLVPFNQFPLLPLPFVVFGLNISTNKVANCNWPCIIICFQLFSFCNIWGVMNFVISIFKNSISFTTCEILMAYVITDELVNNHLFFLFNFLLGFLCTLGNLHALVLRLLKLADGVIPTFALCHPQT